MYSFDIKIMDFKWKVILLDEEEYIEKHGDDAAAHTSEEYREIVFNEEELNLINVKHEVWHAYRYSMGTHAAGLTANQEEEISAELFAARGDQMTRLARKIHKDLKDHGSEE